MLRIRRVFDTAVPRDARQVTEVQKILREQFPLEPEDKIAAIPHKLSNPFKDKLRYVLFIADSPPLETVSGFALMSYDPALCFCYLDYISTPLKKTGRGVGGALYERVREEAGALKVKGVLFECLPDDPTLCSDSNILKQNIERLKFYERYGAKPIVNTGYEYPIDSGLPSDNLPYLVLDTLGRNDTLSRKDARKIVQAIIERKYPQYAKISYLEKLLKSIVDDPVKLRESRYYKSEPEGITVRRIQPDQKISLFVTDRHELHHVKERGYVEAPVRIRSITRALDTLEIFVQKPVAHFSQSFILSVHDKKYVSYLKKVCEQVPSGQSVYPYVFPVRNQNREPGDLPTRAGYYCIDTFTPLNQYAHHAALRAVDCTLSAAKEIKDGARLAYSLVRPPGHHAEKRYFGGFCYFNNCAIAAQYLLDSGKVAILDVDYHHGNGQQDIFYDRSDVLTVSIHGNPRFAYPYFTGYEDECGVLDGHGFNVNYPLKEDLSTEEFMRTVSKALKRVLSFNATFLIVALGFDTAKGDPTGTWSLLAKDFYDMGNAIGSLKLPTLFVQEGGYRTKSLGTNARNFFTGVWHGMYKQ